MCVCDWISFLSLPLISFCKYTHSLTIPLLSSPAAPSTSTSISSSHHTSHPGPDTSTSTTNSHPHSHSHSHIHPPPASKRRRAKRTEEERIEYLRADPYVAQFEAYRVLCASCDKWIRLRPNSTYCSIPWDAHRKSCLAKKMYVFFFGFCQIQYENANETRGMKKQKQQKRVRTRRTQLDVIQGS